MKKIVCFVPLLILLSCASVQSTTSDINGKRAYKLSCSEFNSSLEKCKAKAQELCASDYKLIEYTKEVYPDAGDGVYMHPKHHLVVACGN